MVHGNDGPRATPTISAIGHLSLSVRDLEAAVQNATDVMGLRVRERDENWVRLTHGATHHSLEYRASDVDAVHHVGLEASSIAALDELRSRLRRANFEVLSTRPWDSALTEGLVFRGPERFVFEVYIGMPTAGSLQPASLGVRPNRLGHLSFRVRDSSAMAEFFCSVLDFRVSDTFVDGQRFFLRCNVDHHGVAIVPGRGVLHHHAWEVEGIADLGRLGDRLDEENRHLVWGPVRHGLGRNIAAYFLEPAGAIVEYYADMERVYDEVTHQPGVWDGDDPRFFSLWAPLRPERFREYGLPPEPVASHRCEAGAERMPGSRPTTSSTALTPLGQAVSYAYDRSPYYRQRLDELAVAPDDLQTEEQLAGVPILLDKAIERDLVEQSLQDKGHPYGVHLCAPLEDVVSVCSTSGTTGDPTFYPFTRSDIALMDELWSIAFRFGGVMPGDTVLQAFGLSMFLAGIPIVRALENMGVRVIPVGAEAGSEKLMRFAKLTRPTAICCTPSYGEYLVERYDMSSLGIKHVFCAGEPGAGLPELRARLEAGFGGAQVTDMMGGGKGIMAASCRANAGMHALAPKHWIQQLVDPETHEPLEWRDGAVGVRVLTTLSWRAAPWLRATVGDICEVFSSTCSCGLDSPRFRIVGRSDDMLIIKGVKLYPTAIRDLLSEFVPALTGAFRVVLTGPPPKVTPPLCLKVEVADNSDADLIDTIAQRMHSRFAVTPSIEAVPPGSLERTTHKQSFIEIVSQPQA